MTLDWIAAKRVLVMIAEVVGIVAFVIVGAAIIVAMVLMHGLREARDSQDRPL